MNDPTTTATAWMDGAWDEADGLLWNAPGAFADVTEGPHTVHLVRETAWYAIGLLRRGGPDDRRRAERALGAVIDLQYDEPGEAWHGTFTRFPEWPEPRPGAIEWVDYDPNWRQFVGTALAVAVTDFALGADLSARARAAIELAVVSEPPDRVPPTYANIALLRAWLDAWTGRADTSYARDVVSAYRRHGCFTEHNSPTYYGVDLLALGLWQRADARPDLQALGAEVEAALWTDIARWWHPDLGNLCGPYSRAYGMDLHTYVSGLSLALWCAGLPAPLPDLSAAVVPHGHDLCMAPLLQHLGTRLPEAARESFTHLSGPHLLEQVVDDAPHRVATGWVDHDLLIGAEAGNSGLHARGQFHPATVHWSLPDGGVGWLRLIHHGPTSATASRRRLEVECHPHPRRGPMPLSWESNLVPTSATQDHWAFPGLDIAVSTDAHLDHPVALRYAPKPAGTTRMTLQVTPSAGR